MKKGKLSKIFALTGVLLLGGITAMSTVSCGKTQSSVIIAITGGKNGYVGGLCQLSATVYNYEGEETVTWTSSNTTVATVDSTGLVSFLSAGTVDITATLGDASSSPLSLTVSQGDAALELTSSPSRLSYYTNETLSFDGIKVTGYSYKSGYRLNDSGIDLTSVVSFSMEEGTTLSTEGTYTITVSYGSFAATSFTITVGDTITEKKLYVASNPTTSTYVIPTSENSTANNSFSSTGLVVQGLTYVDGVLDDNETVTLSSLEYSLSINNSQTLLTEGTHTISVYADGYISTSFNVMVYTEDTSVVDFVRTLQSANNYQVEIFNNVGTTSDSYGFHYLRTFTENYYDEISYQNTYNSTTSQIIFSTSSVKSHIGYTSYQYQDNSTQTTTYGIVGYTINNYGELQYDTIVTESTSVASWWDMADTLAELFTDFDLDDFPTYTLNDTFLAITVEQVADDDSNGTKTIANYPFIADFFSYVGWSSSLITITDRLTISFNSSGNLEIRVDFGYYGYTSLVVQNVGTAYNAVVDNFINQGFDSDDWDDLHEPKEEVINAVQPMFNNNYTVTSYSSSSTVYSYMTATYAYYNSSRYGYFIKNNVIYYFTGNSTSNFYCAAVTDFDSTTQTFAQYVTSKANGANVPYLKYLSVAMSSVFGDGTGSDYGKLYSLARNDSYSYGSYVTYQTFDSDVVSAWANYLGTTFSSEYNRFWLMTYYDDADSLTGVNGYDVWVLNSSLSGYALSISNVGTTSVGWIETAIANVS